MKSHTPTLRTPVMKTLMKGRMRHILALGILLVAGGWIGLAGTTLEFQPQQTRITIKGTSTMHDFECRAAAVNGSVQLPGSPNDDVVSALSGLEAVNVTVPVEKIDCGNGTMDKKMRSALNASKAPLVKYTMTSVTANKAADADGFHGMKAAGKLSIAGTERPVELDVRGKQLPDGRFQFTGSKKIRMSEWGISAPTAMLGTMKTGDEVTVVFEVLAGF